MNLLTLDCETSIVHEGNPFSKDGKLCLVGIHDKDGYKDYDIEYTDSPYGDHLKEIKARIEAADLIIGFNLKFDLHWIQRYVPDLSVPDVFDCQLAAFILSRQTRAYPSLDESAADCDLPRKLDVVRTEYWDNGIDTPQIPDYVVKPYLRHDVWLTRKVYDRYVEQLTRKQKLLLKLQCKDLLVLAEMERNGMLYNMKEATRLGIETDEKLQKVDARLLELFPDECINFGSVQHLSVLLYGGSIPVQYREQYERTLKDGTVKQKERWSERLVEFPRLIRPLQRTEGVLTAKLSDEDLREANRVREEAGKKPLRRSWSVSEPVLRRLRPKAGKARELIALLLERARHEQLDSMYYTGLVEKIKSYGWAQDMIHGSFNQCVAITSRLSSSKPNLQNFDNEIKELFYSRYE